MTEISIYPDPVLSPSCEGPPTRESLLATRVILQAVKDYLEFAEDSDSVAGINAYLWFTEAGESSSFRIMCSVAGVNPDGLLDRLPGFLDAYTRYLKGETVPTKDVKILKGLGLI